MMATGFAATRFAAGLMVRILSARPGVTDTTPVTTTPPPLPSTTVPAAPPATTIVPPSDDAGGGTDSGQGIASSVGDVIVEMWDNLGENGYQTGVSLVAATIAIVIMRNMKVATWIQAPVAIGTFWAGWLLWNTLTDQSNPLFPGDIDQLKIWDVARSDQWGFLTAVAAGCIAAVALWRQNQKNGVRIVLVVGTVFGASLVYNLIESIRITAA